MPTRTQDSTIAPFLALTMLEQTAKKALKLSDKRKRQAAATCYNIEENVLHKFGELTSGRGSIEKKNRDLDVLFLPIEPEWIKESFKALILQAAKRAYHNNLPLRQLTMNDLPKLPKS